MPNEISESSGIVYLKGKKEIVTFNDSGGKPELYILNSKSGKLKRTIKIKNAKNHDWESITHDEHYIYIGDTGNNLGNRKNLVIYKIDKADLKKNIKIKAKKIHYSYQDQKFYTKNKHKTNFDCEAITVYNNKLYLFTKNWGDRKTNIYEIPSEKGKYIAQKIHTININSMLTAIAYNSDNNTFIGTAYDKGYKSYLIKINNFNTIEQKVDKISLFKELGLVNQTEAVTWKNSTTVFISREASNLILDGKKYKRKQKLFSINLEK